jgi:hypothetical protein
MRGEGRADVPRAAAPRRLLACAGALAATLAAAPGCLYLGLGWGGKEAADAIAGDGSSAPTPPPALETAPALARADLEDAGGAPSASTIAVRYTLTGQGGGGLAVAWRLAAAPESAFAPATEGPGSDGTENLTAGEDPGVPHVFVWDAGADLAAQGLVEEDVVLRLTSTRGALSAPPREVALRAGNRPPQPSFGPPVAAGEPAPNPVVTRNVITSFVVADTASDEVAVTLAVGDGQGAPVVVPNLIGALGTVVDLVATPAGAPGDIVWDSIARLSVRNVPSAVLVVTATDRFGASATSTTALTVSNDSPTTVTDLAFGVIFGDPLLEGRVPIRFRLVDPEADIEPDGPSGRPDVHIRVTVGADPPVDALGVILREGGVQAGVEPGLGLRARPPGVASAENEHTFVWDARGQGLAGVRDTDVIVSVTPYGGGGAGIGATAAHHLNRRDVVLSDDPPTLFEGTSLQHMDVADIDGDGVPDIVVVDVVDETPAQPPGAPPPPPTPPAPSQLSFWRGAGDGTFPAAVRTPIDRRPAAMVLGDVDGDGTPDAVGAYAGGVQVFRSAGGGAFTPLGLVPVPGTPSALALGDVDADGRLDAVVLLRGAAQVAVLPGDGAGGIAASGTAAAVAPATSQIGLADLDQDGRLDLLHDGNPGRLSVRFGDGAGGFGPEARLDCPGPPVSFAVGDLDGDRVPDVVAGTSNQELAVFLGTGSGGFAPPSIRAYERPSGLRLVDLDGDGLLDLVAFRADAPPILDVAAGLGGGAFGRVADFLSQDQVVVAADLDGDARADLVIQGGNPLEGAFPGAPPPAGSPEVGAHKGQPASLGVLQGTQALTGAGGTPVGFEAADLDADGRADAVLLLSGSRSLLTVLAGADASLVPLPAVPTGDAPRALALGDIDGDGALDAAVAVASPRVRLFRGAPDGTFAPLADAPLPSTPTLLALGRLDGDATLDMVVAVEAPPPASIVSLLGDGAGGFVTAAAVPSPAPVVDLHLADADGDGRLDLVFLDLGGNAQVRPGQGDGAFGAGASHFFAALNPVGLAPGTSAGSLLVTDVDGDGIADLVFGIGGGPPAGGLALFIRRGLGAGRFGGTSSYPWPRAVAAGLRAADLTGDGRPELVFTAGVPAGFGLSVGEFLPDLPAGTAPGRGDGQGAAMSLFRQAFLGPTDPPARVACADFNRDGHADALLAGPVNLKATVFSTARGSVAVPGVPGARSIPSPPMDTGRLIAAGALPAGGRHARASLAYAFLPEGRTLESPATLTLPLHASLDKDDLETRVIRVVAEERTLRPAPTEADSRGLPLHARHFEVARADPGAGPGATLPPGVVPATVDEAAGTIRFEASALLRYQAFVELPAGTAAVYRETFDARAETQPGRAPRPAGWSGGRRWAAGRPIPGTALGDARPAPASAPSLLALGLEGPYAANLDEAVASAPFRLAAAPPGRVYRLKCRLWHDIGAGDRAAIALLVTPPAGGAPARQELAAFTGLAGPEPVLAARSFEVSAAVAAALSAAGASGPSGAEARLELRLTSDGAGSGRGVYADDLELFLAPN